MSIEIECSPIGPVTVDLFAPKKEIVGTPMMDEMWPSPLSVAKAYLQNEIKIILSLQTVFTTQGSDAQIIIIF